MDPSPSIQEEVQFYFGSRMTTDIDFRLRIMR